MLFFGSRLEVLLNVDYEWLVFVPEIPRAQNSVKIMLIRERNEEGMGRGS